MVDFAAANAIRSIVTNMQIEVGVNIGMTSLNCLEGTYKEPEIGDYVKQFAFSIASVGFGTAIILRTAFKNADINHIDDFVEGFDAGMDKAVFYAKRPFEATAFAAVNGLKTISMTKTGQVLHNTLSNNGKVNWLEASKIYAKSARGKVRVILPENDADIADSYWRYEKIILRNNQKVTEVEIYRTKIGEYGDSEIILDKIIPRSQL